MKRLFVIGGPMGVGKTTVCRELQRLLDRAAFLDGDWCWDASPFIVNAETKAMVTDNIRHVLNNFLHCSAYENVIFCWVLHEQAIADSILSRLDVGACTIIQVNLVCGPEALAARLMSDIEAGIRDASVLERSLARLPLYALQETPMLDTTGLTPEKVAEAILGFGL